jgi:hypothetical protein
MSFLLFRLNTFFTVFSFDAASAISDALCKLSAHSLKFPQVSSLRTDQDCGKKELYFFLRPKRLRFGSLPAGPPDAGEACIDAEYEELGEKSAVAIRTADVVFRWQ